MKKEKIKQLKSIIAQLERFNRINDSDLPTVLETLRSAIPKDPRAKDRCEKNYWYVVDDETNEVLTSGSQELCEKMLTYYLNNGFDAYLIETNEIGSN